MRNFLYKCFVLLILVTVLTSLFIFFKAKNKVNLETTIEIHYSELTKGAQKQIDCLAENIYHEARSESEAGRIAVALVTLNRVYHESFPKDICSVVKQNSRGVCQFSWYCMAVTINRNSEEYREAIRNALHVYVNYDVIEDFTDGSLYYHATYVNPEWKLKKTVTIGRHIFYKESEI